MSVRDDVKKLSEELSNVTKVLKDDEFRRVKKKTWKLPFGIRMKSRKAVKQGKILAIILRKNHRLEFKVVRVIGGLIEVDSVQYKAYEEGAIYIYKKIPVVVILDWRLTLVGGMTDFKIAKDLGVADFAQETLIRVIEKVEVEKDLGKKRGKLNWAWLILLLGVVIYFLFQGFGG